MENKTRAQTSRVSASPRQRSVSLCCNAISVAWPIPCISRPQRRPPKRTEAPFLEGGEKCEVNKRNGNVDGLSADSTIYRGCSCQTSGALVVRRWCIFGNGMNTCTGGRIHFVSGGRIHWSQIVHCGTLERPKYPLVEHLNVRANALRDLGPGKRRNAPE